MGFMVTKASLTKSGLKTKRPPKNVKENSEGMRPVAYSFSALDKREASRLPFFCTGFMPSGFSFTLQTIV
jgi:hypothetical protein